MKKVRHLNRAVKYSLLCSWQASCLKTTLTATSLRQVRDRNKVHNFHANPIDQSQDKKVLEVSTSLHE